MVTVDIVTIHLSQTDDVCVTYLYHMRNLFYQCNSLYAACVQLNLLSEVIALVSVSFRYLLLPTFSPITPHSRGICCQSLQLSQFRVGWCRLKPLSKDGAEEMLGPAGETQEI